MSWPCWKHLSVFPAGEKYPASELYANRRLLEESESGAAGTDRSQPPKTFPKADEENVREALWVHLVQAKACPVRRIQRWPSQASARARRKALSRALRVSVAAAWNSERASASRPARNRKSPLAAGNGA